MTRERPSCLAPVSSCSATNATTPGGTSAGADKKVPSVTRLRAALTAGSDTPRAARILAELQEHSPEFVRMWELQEVGSCGDCNTILHPELGRIDVDAQLLFTENRAQTSQGTSSSPLDVLDRVPGRAPRSGRPFDRTLPPFYSLLSTEAASVLMRPQDHGRQEGA